MISVDSSDDGDGVEIEMEMGMGMEMEMEMEMEMGMGMEMEVEMEMEMKMRMEMGMGMSHELICFVQYREPHPEQDQLQYRLQNLLNIPEHEVDDTYYDKLASWFHDVSTNHS